MSPEQVDSADVGPASDLFSLGSVLFFCLTGKPPFPGTNIPAILYHVAQSPYPELAMLRPELDPFWDGILARMLEKDPLKRRCTAQSLAEELRAFLNRKVQMSPRLMVREVIVISGLYQECALPDKITSRLEEKLKTRVKMDTGVTAVPVSHPVGAKEAKEAKGKGWNPDKLILAGLMLVLLVVVGGVIFGILYVMQGTKDRSAIERVEGESVKDELSANQQPVAIMDTDVDSQLESKWNPEQEVISDPVQPELNKMPVERAVSKQPNRDSQVGYLLFRMQEGWNVKNHEVLAALGNNLKYPADLREIVQETRRQAVTHAGAANMLFHADYFEIASFQVEEEYAMALVACERYQKAHQNTLYDEAVETVRKALLEMRKAGLF